MRKYGKNDIEVGVGKMKIKHILSFFKCLLNFSAHPLQSELNKVIISNFGKFQLQRISPEIKRASKKITKFSIRKGQIGQ